MPDGYLNTKSDLLLLHLQSSTPSLLLLLISHHLSGGMLDWLPMGLPRDTPLHPTYREDELKVAFIVGSLGPFPRHT